MKTHAQQILCREKKIGKIAKNGHHQHYWFPGEKMLRICIICKPQVAYSAYRLHWVQSIFQGRPVKIRVAKLALFHTARRLFWSVFDQILISIWLVFDQTLISSLLYLIRCRSVFDAYLIRFWSVFDQILIISLPYLISIWSVLES